MKTMFCVSVLFVFCALPAQAVKVGDTRAAVLAELGKPQGNATMGGIETLFFPGGKIELKNGAVIYIDEGFEETAQKAAAAASFAKEQRARGLVEREGRWLTPEQVRALDAQKAEEERLKAEVARREAAATPAPAPVAAKPDAAAAGRVRVLRQQGQRVELASLLQPGKITIVDFFADWCGPCRALSPLLEHHAAKHADVYLCKVDIVNWGTSVTAQYNINSVPCVCIYGRDGKMIGSPTHDSTKINAYLEKALK